MTVTPSRFALSILIAIHTALSSCVSLPEGRPPNVLVILVDDLGYSDLSCQGCTDFETPHIDALAERGLRLTQGYVSHPYCSPSRAGILTGRYQQRFGHEHNPAYNEEDLTLGTDVNETMLPALLAGSGYRTGHLGKWHVGAAKPFRPIERGYDEFFGFLGGGHHYFKADGPSEYNGPMWRDEAPTEQALSYLTDDLTNEATDFIKRHADEPFFLMLAYNAPHSPDQVPPHYLRQHQSIKHKGRRRYAGLVSGVDAGVGKLMATLEEQGITDNTLVIFLSDNGGRRGVSDNRPLRGNKGWLHEGGLRGPFIITWPGVLEAGETYDEPVIALDILPTTLALAGVDEPSKLDGRDIMPFLTGETTGSPHETLHWRVCGGKGFAIRQGNWKLVHDVSMQKPELYNLEQDLAEDHDLASEHPDVHAKLMRTHTQWAAELSAPYWTEAHARNVTAERAAATKQNTRQFPMPWIK